MIVFKLKEKGAIEKNIKMTHKGKSKLYIRNIWHILVKF